MFLVLYRGSMDDLVVGGFDTYDEAEKEAKKLARYYARWELTEAGYKRRVARGLPRYKPHHPAVQKALEVYSIDVGTYCNVSILVLEGGRPKAMWVYD